MVWNVGPKAFGYNACEFLATGDLANDNIYKGAVNPLTKEIISAMADRDDEKVWKLFEDFDYRYAEEY